MSVSRPHRPGRSRSIALVAIALSIAACEEQELPTDPDAEARFTAIAIDVESARPTPTSLLAPGLRPYDIEAFYQAGPAVQNLSLIVELFLVAYTGTQSTLVLYESEAVTADVGSVDFSGTVTVPTCDSLRVTVYLTDALDLLSFISTDDYRVNISGVASPC